MMLLCLTLFAAVAIGLGLTADWSMICTVTETLFGNTDAIKAADLTKTIVSDQFNESGTLTADTTPPATKHASFVATLDTGAYTINLAALPGLNGAVIDGTGLKLQLLKIKALGANSMVLSEGAANGYAIGDTTVYSGGVTMIFANDKTPDIASGDRTIDIAGTAAQQAEITIVLG